MGGIGSGRRYHWDAKSTTHEFPQLDVRRLARQGQLTPGRSSNIYWTRGGEPSGDISITAETGHIRLKYRTRTNGGDWEPMEYSVRLLSQQCNYGGLRQWFACPAKGCGRRVAILYGGRVFACRHCHRLAYPSQRKQPFERYQDRANTLRKRLGWEGEVWGPKPKGMHLRTFERLVQELDYWETRSTAELESFLFQRVGRLAVFE